MDRWEVWRRDRGLDPEMRVNGLVYRDRYVSAALW